MFLLNTLKEAVMVLVGIIFFVVVLFIMAFFNLRDFITGKDREIHIVKPSTKSSSFLALLLLLAMPVGEALACGQWHHDEHLFLETATNSDKGIIFAVAMLVVAVILVVLYRMAVQSKYKRRSPYDF